VENECTSHIFGSFAIFLPKNYQNRWKFDAVLTKTNLLSFFWDTMYIVVRVLWTRSTISFTNMLIVKQYFSSLQHVLYSCVWHRFFSTYDFTCMVTDGDGMMAMWCWCRCHQNMWDMVVTPRMKMIAVVTGTQIWICPTSCSPSLVTSIPVSCLLHTCSAVSAPRSLKPCCRKYSRSLFTDYLELAFFAISKKQPVMVG